MANILNIETTSKCCSICLSKDGLPWIVRSDDAANGHAERITLFIESVLRTANMDWEAIDALAYSRGPGSYTGLRIGLSTAKGICYAQDKPLIAVDTLTSLAWAARAETKATDGAFVSLMDARRANVYAAVFDVELNTLAEPHFYTLAKENSNFLEHLERDDVPTLYIAGDGLPKYQALIGEHPKVVYTHVLQVSAKYLAALAEAQYQQGEFVDVAYSEPFYLKKPNITKPKKKV